MTAQMISDAYLRWADREARGVSATYDRWARQIADDPAALALIEALPPIKRQPNLIFAAARWCGAEASPATQLPDFLATQWERVGEVVRTRSTQTNEAARCAVLLPALSTIAGPLALLEVGASAGLCLIPDRYSYRYNDGLRTLSLDPTTGPSHVALQCDVNELPSVSAPQIVWRSGLDLNPIDPADSDSVDWLETLVWPEHEERRARLSSALSLARVDPPPVLAGDAVEDLEALAAQAPSDATLIVFHTAVLAYLTDADRTRFAQIVSGLDARWLSCEGFGVLPDLDRQLSAGSERDFIVGLDGRAIALAGPHGQRYRRLPHA